MLLVLLVPFSGSIKVKKITCKTQYGPCTASLEEQLSRLMGARLLTVSTHAIEDIALSLPSVREVHVYKYFYGKLEVVLNITKPYGAIQLRLPNGELSQQLFLVDQGGRRVGTTDVTSLPTLVIPSSLMSISDYNPNLSPYLGVADLMNRARGIKTVELTADALIFRVENVVVWFPQETIDPRLLVGSLQFILARSTIEGKQPVKIDMRFKNPVVVF